MGIAGEAFFHFLRVLFGREEPETQTTQAERDCLRKYAHNKTRLVEIGVFEAVTTAILASSMAPTGECFAIDPFQKGRFGVCWSKLITKIYLRRNKISSKITLVESLSHDAAAIIKGSFDFIFIDGDHSLYGIRTDFEDWSMRLRPSGILALHDTSIPSHNPEVRNLGSYKYYQETIALDPGFKIVETVDSLNILRKVASI